MEEALDNAFEELKRVDHLYYVSLKYTRTVDMIKHVLERMIESLHYGVEALLLQAQDKGKIDAIPNNKVLRYEDLRKLYADDPVVQEYVEFLALLMKLRRAEYKKREEFRRHVTMIATINGGEIMEVNIDLLGEYYEKVKEYIKFVKVRILGEEK